MSKVRTSAYRQTPTPEGLKAIENGTLDYFDTEMYANFNTEVLEEYLEEKNRLVELERISNKLGLPIIKKPKFFPPKDPHLPAKFVIASNKLGN